MPYRIKGIDTWVPSVEKFIEEGDIIQNSKMCVENMFLCVFTVVDEEDYTKK